MRELTDIDVIRDVLGRHGFHFSKSKGQNFLTASWVPEEIVDRACLDENTGVLEIGPGLGSLTVKLSEAAGKVLAVELDETLMPVLAETLQGCENIYEHHEDDYPEYAHIYRLLIDMQEKVRAVEEAEKVEGYRHDSVKQGRSQRQQAVPVLQAGIVLGKYEADDRKHWTYRVDPQAVTLDAVYEIAILLRRSQHGQHYGKRHRHSARGQEPQSLQPERGLGSIYYKQYGNYA